MSGAVIGALLAQLLGVGLFVAGVYVLVGLGWALLAGAAACFAFGWLVLRGLRAPNAK